MDDKQIQDELDRLKKSSESYRHIIDENIKRLEADGKSTEEANKSTLKFVKSMEDASKRFKKSYDEINIAIDGLKKRYKSHDVTSEELEESLKALRKQVEHTTDQDKKAALIQAKSELESAYARNKATEVFKDGLGALSGTVIKGVANSFTSAAKSALGGGDALKVAADFMSSNIDTANQASQVGSKALTDFGTATAGAGGNLKYVGITATAAGSALGFLSNSVSELAKAGIGFMLTQTTKMISGFQAMNQAGAMYVGGMQKMVETSLDAGMTIDQFSKSVSENKEALSGLGLGVGEASKKLSSAMKEGGAAARKGMFALGMSVEEQAGAYATVMRRMAGPDQRLKASDAEIAARTEEYAKNLAVLKNLTGEEVNSKRESIRKANDTLAMNQKMSQMDPLKRAALEEAMENMTESQQIALRENMIYGNVISRDIAVAQAANAGIAQSNQDFANAVKDGSISAKTARDIQAKNRAATERDAKDAEAMAMAQGEVAMGASKVINEQWQYQEKFSEDSLRRAEKTAKAELEKGKSGIRKKGENLGAADLMEINQNFAIKLQKVANTALPAFEEALIGTINDISKAVDSMVDFGVGGSTIPAWATGILSVGASLAQIASTFGFAKAGTVGAAGAATGGANVLGKAGSMLKGKGGLLGAGIGAYMAYDDYKKISRREELGIISDEEAKKAKGGVVGEAGGGLAGAAAGAMGGAAAGALLGPIGAAVGGVLGGVLGGLGGGWAGKKGGEAVAGQFANGGIATGPASGYTAMLHNKELVLPLTDSGAPKAGTQGIEELMKAFGMSGSTSNMSQSSDVAELIKEQNSKLDDLIRIMGDNRDYTERLMHNMS